MWRAAALTELEAVLMQLSQLEQDSMQQQQQPRVCQLLADCPIVHHGAYLFWLLDDLQDLRTQLS